MKERHWDTLTAALRHGECVLVLGDEIPVNVPPNDPSPTSNGNMSFVEALRCKLARDLEDDNQHAYGGTLAAVAQQYEDTEGFGPNNLRAAAEKFFRSSTFRPSAVHEKLASLPCSLVLTTCQDALLVDSLKAAGKTPITQRYHLRGDKRDNPEFSLTESPISPIVFHLFGEAQEPSSLVLSENDILDFLIAVISERPPLPNSLLRALKHGVGSFLFVGFGVRHWDLRILLKVLIRLLEFNRGRNAIAAEPLRGLLQADREEMILFYQRGMRVELEDTDIGVFLTELSRRLETEGGYAGPVASTGPHPRVFISYAREDKDLAARVFDSLRKANFEPWLDRESLEGGEEWDRRIEAELEASDFILVLYTPALCRKTDSYVNKEIALARDRALKVRGRFLIPLRTSDVVDSERIDELHEYNDIELRPNEFDADISKTISTMLREYQRRNR